MSWFFIKWMLWFSNSLCINYPGAQLMIVNVSEGMSAVLKCQEHSSIGLNKWIADNGISGSTIYTLNTFYYFDKVRIVGSVTNGEYNLQIDNVSATDEGIYKCFRGYKISAVIELVVQAKPKNLQIHGTVNGRLHGLEGTTLQLICTFKTGIPTKTLSWYNMSSIIGTGGHTTLNITITPTKYDNLKTYTCLVTSDSLHNLLQETVTLEIQFKPQNLKIHGTVNGKLLGQEDKSLQLLCTVISGNPKETLTWYNMSTAIGTGGPGMLNITITPTRYDNKKTYTCLVQELLQATVTLEIQFKPKDIKIHGTVKSKLLGQEGKSLQLLCTVISGFPKETITWYKMSSAIDTGGPGMLNISIIPTRYDNLKTYTCRVTSDSLQELLQETVILEIQSKPIFAASTENIQYGRIGTEINLSVSVYCYPKFRNVNIQTSDFCCFNETEYQLVTDINITVSSFDQSVRMKGYNISLQGFTLTETDFTTYNFWIQNEIGVATFDVKLVAKEYKFESPYEYGSGWLVMGCVVGGIVICSIASNIYCYRKRKTRANVVLETYQEEHYHDYDEIGTINYNNEVFEPTTDVTQENNDMPVVSGESTIRLGVEPDSSEESSLERMTGVSQSGDGYENPYHSINPEIIEMHPYSSIMSNIYQNTIIFPARSGTKNKRESVFAEETSKNPWLIIYIKKQ